MVRVREAEENIDILGTIVMGGKEGMERKEWKGRNAVEAIQRRRYSWGDTVGAMEWQEEKE